VLWYRCPRERHLHLLAVGIVDSLQLIDRRPGLEFGGRAVVFELRWIREE